MPSSNVLCGMRLHTRSSKRQACAAGPVQAAGVTQRLKPVSKQPSPAKRPSGTQKIGTQPKKQTKRVRMPHTTPLIPSPSHSPPDASEHAGDTLTVLNFYYFYLKFEGGVWAFGKITEN